MTGNRLTEVEARLSAATPGPWEHVERRFEGGRIREHSVETHHHVIADDLSLNSAELIAHAPTDLAALVAVVREVESLHKHDGAGDCIQCGWESGWPCPTAAAVQKLERSADDAGEADPFLLLILLGVLGGALSITGAVWAAQVVWEAVFG